jgi:hypothetical protein
MSIGTKQLEKNNGWKSLSEKKTLYEAHTKSQYF